MHEDHALSIGLNAMKNARSVTARIFMTDKHGQNHCQAGNIGLALDVMLKWIAGKS